MFPFFHKSTRENGAIIAEQDKSNQNHAGFVVRRVRRV
jgi:hypothetical protein